MNTAQRLRIRFTRGDEIKYISHLDIMRLWQRAFIRAGIDLAYSEGFNPRPKISLAAPLALGVTSQGELMDITLVRWSSPHAFEAAVNRQLPGGVSIKQVLTTGLTVPSLQSLVRFAEYSVTVATPESREDVQARLTDLMAKESIPWQHRRDTGLRKYDLRPLVDDLWFAESVAGAVEIGMLLRCDSNGSGRPEQVAAALGFETYPRSIHRTRLILQAG